MTISFNTIPMNTRVPGQMIEFDSSRAVSGLPSIDNRVLLVGQRLAAGSAAALTIQSITEAAEAITLFGRGSMLARMAAAFRKIDGNSRLFAIALDDAVGSAAATGTITVTGPATAAGTIALMVAGVAVPVGVVNAASAATVATAIAAAINAKPDLPVTAAAAAAVVTLTSRNKGTCGNAIDIRHSHNDGEALPAGIGLSIVAMSGGATDPDIDTIWPVIGDNAYRTLIVGNVDATVVGKLKIELDDRWGAIRMLETVAYGAKAGTQGTLSAFGAAQNAVLCSVLGTGKSPTWAPDAAAMYGAVCGYYTAIDPARPVQTLTLTGMVAPKDADKFTRTQREALLQDGVSTFTADDDGTCRIERAITMYQTNAQGIDDTAYLNLETVTTVSYLRASLRSRIASKFPRHKLADDGTNYGAGQAIVTPKVLRNELIALAREWEDAGLVENLDQFVADLIVERDATDKDRANALVPPDIINQFRQFAAAIQFRL